MIDCKFIKLSGIQKVAFTLAEILVVGGIIGVISMLLMPRLLEGYNEMIVSADLKRAYNITANAFNNAVVANGGPESWNAGSEGDQAGLENLNAIMSKQLNVIKNCGTKPGCFPDVKYKDLTGVESPDTLNQDNSYTKMIIASGASISLKNWSPDCSMDWGDTFQLRNVCGMVGIDINGLAGPNKYGEDYFGFIITKLGVIPMGTTSQDLYSFDDFCNRASSNGEIYGNGIACTAWVLANNNTKYKGNCGNGVGIGGKAGSGLGNGNGNTCVDNRS